MSFLLLELAANPDIQIAVRKEIVHTLNKHNGEVTYESVKDLTYLDMVISGEPSNYTFEALKIILYQSLIVRNTKFHFGFLCFY